MNPIKSQPQNLFVALLLVYGLAGCTAVPSLPQIEAGSVTRIGVFVPELGQPTQTHVGTTIFNNNVKEYDLGWDLRAEFLELINTEIVAAGYEVFDLEAAGFSLSDFPVVETTDEASFSVSNVQSRQRLIELEVDAVITLAELDKVLAQVSCSQFGCSEQWAESYGLYTRRFLGIGHATALFAFDVRAETISEVASLGESKEMQHFARWERSSRKLEKMPTTIDDVENMTWDRVRNELHAALRERVVFALALMNGEDAEVLKAASKGD